MSRSKQTRRCSSKDVNSESSTILYVEDESVVRESFERTTEGTIDAFGRMAELRDPYTAGHQRRVARLAYRIGRSMGISERECRGIHVADTVEAMSSHRPYRPALGIEAALVEIEANRGKLYCPDSVDACVKIIKNEEFSFEE